MQSGCWPKPKNGDMALKKFMDDCALGRMSCNLCTKAMMERIKKQFCTINKAMQSMKICKRFKTSLPTVVRRQCQKSIRRSAHNTGPGTRSTVVVGILNFTYGPDYSIYQYVNIVDIIIRSSGIGFINRS